ncbi:MAG TPA: 7-cyano-7-deazaguanine synthase [Bdellovibrionota bacterium]|nr:7-cyano-7-deazaguanine synthase [Bdellovibrionota bacterium]
MSAHKRNAAVLVSGGLDSAVLLAECAEIWPQVTPIFIRSGLLWEEAELRALRRFVASLAEPSLTPIAELTLGAAQMYGDDHWSVNGARVPKFQDPDPEVYLPGRNLLLLSHAATFCSLTGIDQIFVGLLRGNPFPDASEKFLEQMARTVSMALGRPIEIHAPYRQYSKSDVILRGRRWPIHLTLSCLQPRGGRHCGKCNKCAERQKAFQQAGIIDPTDYGAAVRLRVATAP